MESEINVTLWLIVIFAILMTCLVIIRTWQIFRSDNKEDEIPTGETMSVLPLSQRSSSVKTIEFEGHTFRVDKILTVGRIHEASTPPYQYWFMIFSEGSEIQVSTDEGYDVAVELKSKFIRLWTNSV